MRDGTVRARVGIGLRGGDGLAVGSLLLLDPNPRSWKPSELDSVRELADAIESRVALAAFAGPPQDPAPRPLAALFERRFPTDHIAG